MKTVKMIMFPLVLMGIVPLAGCSGGGGSDGEDIVFCGGADGDTCTASQFCRYDDFSCGQAATSRGVCKEVPIVDCNAPATAPVEGEVAPITGPVCSCDRLTFKNECWSLQAKVSLQAAGECA